MAAEIRKNDAGRFYWALLADDGKVVATTVAFDLKREAEAERDAVEAAAKALEPTERVRDTRLPDKS